MKQSNIHLRSSYFTEIQESTAHYNNIIALRSLPSFSVEQSPSKICKNNYKPNRYQQYQRKFTNKKILNRLISIHNQSFSNIKKITNDQAYIKNHKKSLKNKTRQNQKLQQIQTQNQIFQKRLKKIAPLVGTIGKWNSDFDFNKKLKNMRKKNNFLSSTEVSTGIQNTYQILLQKNIIPTFKIRNEIDKQEGRMKIEVKFQQKVKNSRNCVKIRKKKTKNKFIDEIYQNILQKQEQYLIERDYQATL